MNPDVIVDLHTHSDCSDGALPPEGLVERAAAAGIGLLALTDHDSIDGLQRAQAAAARCGLTLVNGAEISATWRAQTIHVLGLWIDPGCGELRAGLALQSERRRDRMQQMCARLSKLGLPGQQLLESVQAQRGVPTRTHLAAALVAGGHAKTPADAFRRYLAQGKSAYRNAPWPPLAEVIGWIRSAGGKASLAHPMRYALSSGARRQLVSDFAQAGGAALEVVTGSNAAQHIETCAELALKFNLGGTVGSDFHDPKLAWNPLGRLAKLPGRIVPIWRDVPQLHEVAIT